MENPVAPDSVLNLINCKCKQSCATRRCSCLKNGLSCSDLCQCENCENKNHIDESTEDISDTFSDIQSDESDEEDDLDYSYSA